ncbi:MAG: UvrD-helicase domain-containing protein [Acidimicrobiales bacterium]
MTADDRPFDVLGELPAGQVAIEASAGTGKTFALAALATRYLAERDIAPSELLIVTFTRAATAELRSRIRQQLVSSASALAGDHDEFGDDDLSRCLAGQDRPRRRDRLDRAVSEFDAVAISTMHSFAAQVRSTLGVSSAIDPDARLSTDVSKLIRHACADALAVAAAGDVPVDELPKLSALVTATEQLVGGSDMRLEPTDGRPGATRAEVRMRDLVLASRRNLVDRQLGSGTLSFDDVLTQLRDALVHDPGSAVVDALRSRFTVVLIDEFQDTDRVQWEIFSTLFGAGSPHSTLVLVGDPKQAIYRFRGADVSVYLDAVGPRTGSTRYTLDTNWRSDGAMLRALHEFFDGATFGHEAIGYAPVRASDANEPLRMTGPDGASLSGLDIRLAVGPDLPRKAGSKVPVTPRTGRIVERDMVAHIRDLLDRASIPDDRNPGGTRSLRPSDVAVLVTSGAHARSAQTALRRQGIPAVIAGAGSVLSSWAADQLRLLLAAMERPSDLGRVRAYALSWFVPWSAAEVASASDGELAVLQEELADWSARLADRPVAEVLAHIWSQTGVVARLLGQFDGDRNATDLDHLAELMHASVPHGMSGVAGLVAVVDRPPESEGDVEVDGDVVARRIETEAGAVRIMTVWKAKGLQFPVVCLPMLWRPGRSSGPVVYTDPDTGDRVLDLANGKDWPDRKGAEERKRLARAEEAGERLRLLYVALTRAQHHTAVWWADSTGSNKRALSCFLFARDGGTGRLDDTVFRSGVCAIPPDGAVAGALEGLAARSDGTVSVTVVDDRRVPDAPWSDRDAGARPAPLGIAPFRDDLDRTVHRWSFSSMTAQADEGGVDPYDPSVADRGADDEAHADGTDGAAGDTREDAPAPSPAGGPLGGLVAGTSFGTFVHGVLERVDFADLDLEEALQRAVDAEVARTGFDPATLARDADDGRGRLVAGLQAAIRTPLGPLFDGTCLAGLDRRDRLDELGFDMRIGAGGRHPTVRDIGALVVDHLPGDHLLTPWARSLADGSIDASLAGFLTGSIDLVARIRSDSGSTGYVVADYKTNQLVPRGREPRRDDYGVRSMADAMSEHHYPLQALLYAVALQRYLRSRHRAGTPPPRVTGAAYLFVRGMTGPEVTVDDGHPHGVFTWELPTDLVAGLSALLDGRPVASGGR